MKEAPDNSQADPERRDFLSQCARFATLVPPAMTVLLSTTLTSGAVAGSGGMGKFPRHHLHDHDDDHDDHHRKFWSQR